jgi:hypothetical protein
MPAHQPPVSWRERVGDPRVYGFWRGNQSLWFPSAPALDLGPTLGRRLDDPYWHGNVYGARTTTQVTLEPVYWR